MPRVSIGGSSLYYEIEGDGDWLVFAHGGDGNHLCWWKQIAALSGRFRCLAYDAPGYGLSDARAPANARAPADDLIDLMDHLGIDRAILVGHSMGGMAVSAVAQQYPGRVRGLVMSDTPFGFATPAMSRWATQMIDKIAYGFNVMDHLFAPGYAARDPETYYLYMAICRMRSADVPARPEGQQAFEPYYRMRDAASQDYSALGVPALFVVGDQDELTLPWLIKETAAAVAGSSLCVIPGAGHSPFVEQSLLYNDALAGFFSQLKD